MLCLAVLRTTQANDGPLTNHLLRTTGSGESWRRKHLGVHPNRWLSSFVGQVPIEGRSAHSEVLGNIFAGVAIGLHPLCCGDLTAIVDLLGPSELGPVSARYCPLQRSTFFCQLSLIFG